MAEAADAAVDADAVEADACGTTRRIVSISESSMYASTRLTFLPSCGAWITL